jgi:hypothetical protein
MVRSEARDFSKKIRSRKQMLQAQSTDISRQIHQVRGLCLKLRHHAPCVTATISQQPSHPVSCQFPRLANILFTLVSFLGSPTFCSHETTKKANSPSSPDGVKATTSRESTRHCNWTKISNHWQDLPFRPTVAFTPRRYLKSRSLKSLVIDYSTVNTPLHEA